MKQQVSVRLLCLFMIGLWVPVLPTITKKVKFAAPICMVHIFLASFVGPHSIALHARSIASPSSPWASGYISWTMNHDSPIKLVPLRLSTPNEAYTPSLESYSEL